MDALQVHDWDAAMSAGAEPDYYQRLGLSVMRLPVHDASAQLLRPPALLDLAGGPAVPPAQSPPAEGTPLSPSAELADPFVPRDKAAGVDAPWEGLFGADTLWADEAVPKKRSLSLTPLPQPAGLVVAPLVPSQGTVLPPVAQQVPQEQQQQQQQQQPAMLPFPQLPQPPLLSAPPAPLPPLPQEAAPRGLHPGGRPKMQRVKRAALNDLFLGLKRACYGDAVGRDPLVTPEIGRGKRSVNSKDAILNKALSLVQDMRARVAALEGEIAELSASGPAASPAAASSASSASGSTRPLGAPVEQQQQQQQQEQPPAPVNFVELYRTSSAARFLTEPSGALLAFSDAMAGEMGVPREALEQAARGDLSALSLLPGRVRAAYYAALPELLSGAGAGHATVSCEAEGQGQVSGALVVTRTWSGAGAGRRLLLDHVWVPDRA